MPDNWSITDWLPGAFNFIPAKSRGKRGNYENKFSKSIIHCDRELPVVNPGNYVHPGAAYGDL